MEATSLSTVSVICGPLSGWVVDVTAFYLVVVLFLCFAFGYSKELGCVGKTHTLTFSQVPMILCSCIGLFHRHGKSLPQQVFKVKTNSHPWSFLPNFWQVLCKTWGPACFLKARMGTLNLIHNSGEKLLSCTSLWWKSSLQLLGPGFGQPNFTWNPVLRWAVDLWASKAIRKHLKIGFRGKGAYWPQACRFPLLKAWGCFWCFILQHDQDWQEVSCITANYKTSCCN